MGVSVGGRCYSGQSEAAQAACSSGYPVSFAASGVVTTWSCTGVSADGSALLLHRADTDGGSGDSSVAVSMPSCDAGQPYSEMFQLWSLALAALAIVWVLRRLVVDPLFANQ